MAEELLDHLIVVAVSRKFVALVMFGIQPYLHYSEALTSFLIAMEFVREKIRPR